MDDEFGSCPVCLERMSEKVELGVFVAAELRKCPHILCFACAGQLLQKKCPKCNEKFESVQKLPSPLKNQVGWERLMPLNKERYVREATMMANLEVYCETAVLADKILRALFAKGAKECTARTAATVATKLITGDNSLFPFLKVPSPDLSLPHVWWDYWAPFGLIESFRVVEAVEKTLQTTLPPARISEIQEKQETWTRGLFLSEWKKLAITQGTRVKVQNGADFGTVTDVYHVSGLSACSVKLCSGKKQHYMLSEVELCSQADYPVLPVHFGSRVRLRRNHSFFDTLTKGHIGKVISCDAGGVVCEFLMADCDVSCGPEDLEVLVG